MTTHEITRHEDSGWHYAKCSCGKSSPMTTKGQATAWVSRHLNAATQDTPMPAKQREPLTDTELQTLAVLLDSATKHMETVRTVDGRWAWTDDYLDAVAEVQAGFYAIQVDQNVAAGQWNKMLVPLHG